MEKALKSATSAQEDNVLHSFGGASGTSSSYAIASMRVSFWGPFHFDSSFRITLHFLELQDAESSPAQKPINLSARPEITPVARMHTTLTILLTTTSILLNIIIVHATPATPPFAGGQLITANSNSPGAPLSNASTAGNVTAPGIPYAYNTCTGPPYAPLSDCLSVLSQFPAGFDREFHRFTPHDPSPDYVMPAVRRSGSCRIIIDLLGDAEGAVTPTVWSWDGVGGLLNTAQGLLEACTKDASGPVQGRVTGGVSILSLLETIYPGFKIEVMRTAVVPNGEGAVDVT